MICKMIGVRGGTFRDKDNREVSWCHLFIDEGEPDTEDDGRGGYHYGVCPSEISVPPAVLRSVGCDNLFAHCGGNIELLYDVSLRGGKAVLRDIILMK